MSSLDPSRPKKRTSAATRQAALASQPAATTLTFATAAAYKKAARTLAALTDQIGKHLKGQTTTSDLTTQDATITIDGATITHNTDGVAGTVNFVVLPTPLEEPAAKKPRRITAKSELAAAFQTPHVRAALPHLFGIDSLETAAKLLCDDHNAAKKLQPGDAGFKTACVLPKTAPVGAEPALQKSHLVSQVLGLIHSVVEKEAGTDTAAISAALTAQPGSLIELPSVKALFERVTGKPPKTNAAKLSFCIGCKRYACGLCAGGGQSPAGAAGEQPPHP